MKRTVRLTAVILFVLSSHDLTAQIEYGQIIGLNLSRMSLQTGGVNYKPGITPGIHFGGYIDLPIARNLVFQPALLFTSKGSSYRHDSTYFSITPIYAEIPCNLMLKIGSGEIRFTVYCGPYVACGAGGNTLPPGGSFKNISYGNGPDDDLKRFDYGYNVGGGLNIGEVLVSVQYGSSLVNLSPEKKKENDIENRVIGISLSMLMTAKK